MCDSDAALCDSVRVIDTLHIITWSDALRVDHTHMVSVQLLLKNLQKETRQFSGVHEFIE